MKKPGQDGTHVLLPGQLVDTFFRPGKKEITMQALRNTSFSMEQQSAALAHLAIVDTRTVIELMTKSDDTEALVASLAKYPGALERLAFADLSPKWLKSLVRDVLEDADSPILS